MTTRKSSINKKSTIKSVVTDNSVKITPAVTKKSTAEKSKLPLTKSSNSTNKSTDIKKQRPKSVEKVIPTSVSKQKVKKVEKQPTLKVSVKPSPKTTLTTSVKPTPTVVSKKQSMKVEKPSSKSTIKPIIQKKKKVAQKIPPVVGNKPTTKKPKVTKKVTTTKNLKVISTPFTLEKALDLFTLILTIMLNILYCIINIT